MMKNLDAEVNEIASNEAMEVDVEENKQCNDMKDNACEDLKEDTPMNVEGEENGHVDKSDEPINDLNNDVAPSSDFELELSETETETEPESQKNSAENSKEDLLEAVNSSECDTTLENTEIEKDGEKKEESEETTEEEHAVEEKEATNNGETEQMLENDKEDFNNQNQESETSKFSESDQLEETEVDGKHEEPVEETSKSAGDPGQEKDSCKVLVSMFVDSSTNEKKDGDTSNISEGKEAEKTMEDESNSKESIDEDEKTVAEKTEETMEVENNSKESIVEEKDEDTVAEKIEERSDKNTISLEMAGDDDSNHTSEEELDINLGLEKCFKDLEKRVEQEEEKEVSSEESKDEGRDAVGESETTKAVTKDTVSQSVNDSNSTETLEDIVALDDEDEGIDDGNDHDKALEELEIIEKTTKKILDEADTQSSKRPPSEDDSLEPAAKKTKVDDDNVEEIDHHRLKKVLKRMTRKDLEDMIQTKMVEILTNRSEIGDLRQKVDSYQKTVEKWQARAQALSKQCTDLGTVMKKYITDKKNKPVGSRVVPVKITRSVGLQVMTADQRQKQQQQLKQQQPTAGARIATKPQSVVAVNRAVASPIRKSPASPVKILVNNNSNGVRQRVQGSVVRSSPAAANVTKLSPQQLAAVVRSAGQVSLTPKPAAAPAVKKTVIDVVDLSDEDEPLKPQQALVQKKPIPRQMPGAVIMRNGMVSGVHPAPLPPTPATKHNPSWKIAPSKPSLKINKRGNGIVLSWNLSHNVGTHASILSYQLFAYQETPGQRPDSTNWKKVGDVKALPLPMACTLTQFNNGNKYHFAVRALDCHNRLGPFSDPQNIKLT